MHIAVFYCVRVLTPVKFIVFSNNDAGCPNRHMHIIIPTVNALTGLCGLDLLVDVSVTCVYKCNRAHRIRISYDSDA
jgi:hypothetical protein